MRILVACEYSGTVRDAFTMLGHQAMSCDLLPTESPGLHYQGDVRDVLDGWMPVQFSADCDPDGDDWCSVIDASPSDCQCIGPTQDGIEYMEKDDMLFGRPYSRPQWDLMIAHPPCTYLSVSGMHWTKRGLRDPQLTEDALDFVRLLLGAPIDRIALEILLVSSQVKFENQTRLFNLISLDMMQVNKRVYG